MTFHRVFAGIATAIVLLAVVWGFILSGSPMTQRLRNFDDRRVEDLRAIVNAVYSVVSDGRPLMSKLRGLTLVEVVIASLIASIVAGGTLTAFVASSRMMGSQDLVTNAEASALAQETIEQFRNRVTAIQADMDWWAAQAASTANDGWVAELLPPSVGGTESKLDAATSKRCYRVRVADCDGVGGPGDCYAVQSRVCWNDVSICPC